MSHQDISELPENIIEIIELLVVSAHTAGIKRQDLLRIVQDAQDTHAELEADLDEPSLSPLSDAMLAQARELGHEVVFLRLGPPVLEDLCGYPVVVSCGDR